MFWFPTGFSTGHHFLVHYNIDCQATELYCYKTEYRNGDQNVYPTVTWGPKEDGSRATPLLRLHDREEVCPPGGNPMQNLFDALWACGLRPKMEWKPSDIVNAKEAHIEDLRKLLFKQNGVQ